MEQNKSIQFTKNGKIYKKIILGTVPKDQNNSGKPIIKNIDDNTYEISLVKYVGLTNERILEKEKELAQQEKQRQEKKKIREQNAIKKLEQQKIAIAKREIVAKERIAKLESKLAEAKAKVKPKTQ